MTIQGPGFLLEQVDEADDEWWSGCGCFECRDEFEASRGTVSIAPVGTDPLTAAGWTDIGWVDADDLQFGGDDGETFSCDVDRIGKWSATIKVPHLSRETIALAMGLDAAEQLAPREPWPPERDSLVGVLGIPVTVSPWLPPGQVIIGTPSLPTRVWPPEPRERDWWQDGMWAYRAVERIAMQVQRPHSVTVTSSVPTIGRPPRKSRLLTGRRYRIARRAYARKRRAWIRQGSPTYATEIHMPSVILTGLGIA